MILVLARGRCDILRSLASVMVDQPDSVAAACAKSDVCSGRHFQKSEAPFALLQLGWREADLVETVLRKLTDYYKSDSVSTVSQV